MKYAQLREFTTQNGAQSIYLLEGEESYFREKCDHVLENNGTEAEFQEKCLAFFRQFIIMK